MQIRMSTSGHHYEADTGDLSPGQFLFHPQTREDITSFNTDLFMSSSFRNLAAHRLSGAVKIPCVTYDGMDKVGTDPRWNIFYLFTQYLRETFPML